MATILRFEDLEAWAAARNLRQAVYHLTRSTAFRSDYALVDQIRRAAISIGSNIAEGFERGGNREFIQFLSNAKGSIGEVKDQLYCALDEHYVTAAEFDETYKLAQKTSRLVGGLMAYLQRASISGPKFIRSSIRTPKA